MPLAGFKCPIHRTNEPVDHFETCTALRGRSPFPPWMAHAIAEGAANDVRHAGLDVTATRLTGCPRATLIETGLWFYADPTKMAAMTKGTALHEAALKRFDPAHWMTEINDPVRSVLTGTVFGVRLSMKADAIRHDLTEIVDLKFPSDFSAKWRASQGGRAKPEHAIQLNLARILLAQQSWAIEAGYDPTTVNLTLWDHAAEPEPLVAPHMDEDAMLAVQPFGGDATVREILETHLWMIEQAGVAGVAGSGIGSVERERLAATLPLIGETMMNGKKCTQYCTVGDVCAGIVRKYGRPEALADDSAWVAIDEATVVDAQDQGYDGPHPLGDEGDGGPVDVPGAGW